MDVINKILRSYHVCFVRRRKHKVDLHVGVYRLHGLAVACKLRDKFRLEFSLHYSIVSDLVDIYGAIVCTKHYDRDIGSKRLCILVLLYASVVVCIVCGVFIIAVVGKHGSS